jgi:hypothetical protein
MIVIDRLALVEGVNAELVILPFLQGLIMLLLFMRSLSNVFGGDFCGV